MSSTPEIGSPDWRLPAAGDGRRSRFWEVNVPEGLWYTKDHEWVRVDGARLTVGVTDFAQDALGDVVFVQLPQVGIEVGEGDAIAEVESTKSVSDVYAPAGGRVVEVNADLVDAPQQLNEDPYGAGWICVLEAAEATRATDAQAPAGAASLLAPDDYRALIQS